MWNHFVSAQHKILVRIRRLSIRRFGCSALPSSSLPNLHVQFLHRSCHWMRREGNRQIGTLFKVQRHREKALKGMEWRKKKIVGESVTISWIDSNSEFWDQFSRGSLNLLRLTIFAQWKCPPAVPRWAVPVRSAEFDCLCGRQSNGRRRVMGGRRDEVRIEIRTELEGLGGVRNIRSQYSKNLSISLPEALSPMAKTND